MNIFISILLGLLLFGLDLIATRLMDFLLSKILKKDLGYTVWIWSSSIVFLTIGSWVVFLSAKVSGDAYLFNGFIILATDFCLSWRHLFQWKRLSHVMGNGKLNHERVIELRETFKSILLSIILSAIAYLVGIGLIKIMGGISPDASGALPHQKGVLPVFFLISSYLVASVYAIGGAVCIVVSVNSKKMFKDVGVIMAIPIVAYGLGLYLALYFFSTEFSGLVIALSGLLPYICIKLLKGTHDDEPLHLALSLFFTISFIAGIGHSFCGLVV